MKFTPEEHLKFARSALRAAEAATKPKQARLVSLAHAHQILATPRWQNGKRTVTDANAGLDG